VLHLLGGSIFRPAGVWRCTDQNQGEFVMDEATVMLNLIQTVSLSRRWHSEVTYNAAMF